MRPSSSRRSRRPVGACGFSPKAEAKCSFPTGTQGRKFGSDTVVEAGVPAGVGDGPGTGVRWGVGFGVAVEAGAGVAAGAGVGGTLAAAGEGSPAGGGSLPMGSPAIIVKRGSSSGVSGGISRMAASIISREVPRSASCQVKVRFTERPVQVAEWGVPTVDQRRTRRVWASRTWRAGGSGHEETGVAVHHPGVSRARSSAGGFARPALFRWVAVALAVAIDVLKTVACNGDLVIGITRQPG